MESNLLERGMKGAIAISLSLASVSSIALGIGTGNPLMTFIGGCEALLVGGVAKRTKTTFADIGEGFELLTASAASVVDSVGLGGETSVNAVVRFLPEDFQSKVEEMFSDLQNTDWISGILRRSKILVGGTGAGKTVYEQFEIAKMFEYDPNTKLTICDINYGKPDDKGNLNNWLGLPKKKFIRVNIHDIIQTIHEYAAETRRRAKFFEAEVDRGATTANTSDLQPWYLLIDEGSRTLEEAQSVLGKEEFEDLMIDVGVLLKESRAYKLFVTFVTQDLLIFSMPGFHRGFYRQCSFLVLGNAAEDEEVIDKIPGLKGGSKDLIQKIKEVRQKKGCQYACIVKDLTVDNGSPFIRVLPFIDVTKLSIAIPSEGEIGQMFLNEKLTEEVVLKLALMITDEANGGKSQWLNALKLVGMNKNSKAKMPQEFDAFKAYYESLRLPVTVIHPVQDTKENCLVVAGSDHE